MAQGHCCISQMRLGLSQTWINLDYMLMYAHAKTKTLSQLLLKFELAHSLSDIWVFHSSLATFITEIACPSRSCLV